ncbi:glyoxalase/bleomycin resistance/extradiol dioxygenase family protein [Falsochrobactrum shanghaiense]|uniref:Glyoxalase/bleomycin resistance/extradiol dioxygenase family protein n=1 Tax=Falsochrobactrum shanghaiense TaxID=2201899 RepID=A0A316JCK8_9HYPH|nr:VOC family protein [Falsochrobactrum shanghaiense]PWL18415.1 glyoxalase/bleomycin resistance/extradiol dioxygenase family protein [Falsochrobactrum shanghaiense]
MTSYQGNPCWYELGTGNLAGACDFYAKIFGWQIMDSGMEGFEYRLARSEGDMVAGMMSNAAQEGNPPPHWLIYFAVDDCDKSVAAIKAAGGKIFREPADIPGTGRFAVVADPQGAAFGLLQPDMSRMSDADRTRAEAGEGAFNQQKAGHGNWNELMSSDPDAGFDFYAGLFGWTKGEAMPMGEMGVYQLFRHKGTDIGGMMGLGDAPVPAWLPYFGVDGAVSGVVETIGSAGGKVHYGPIEVPGPAFIAVAQDPQGAWFAVVGAEN